MNSSGTSLEALQEEVSKLTLRLKELDQENRDLRDICIQSGIPYKERLAVRRHKRYFEQLCVDQPIESTATASDMVGAALIVRTFADYAGSVVCPALIDRDFFAAFAQLTAQFPWRFSGRMSTTCTGHREWVRSLAVLEGGRLASGSDDGTIKIWQLATSACVAILDTPGNTPSTVNALAVLEDGRLASAADMRINIWELANAARVTMQETTRERRSTSVSAKARSLSPPCSSTIQLRRTPCLASLHSDLT